MDTPHRGSTAPLFCSNDSASGGMVRVRGAREHNLKNVDVDIPRDALVVFTGVSGSGKSSLAFGTLYAEAQRRYLESVSPYARRLFHQLSVPEVDSIDGLPPAVALQQQRGSPDHSLFGRQRHHSLESAPHALLPRRRLSPRTAYALRGELLAEPARGGLPEMPRPGAHLHVTEQSMVPDPTLTIRERAIAAWPSAWQGQNQRDILVSLGYDVDRPWRELPRKDRDWILFTEEQPTVPVYAGFTPAETRRALRAKTEPSYMGTFTSARRYVLETFAKTQSAMMKRRVSAFMLSTECPVCHGKRLRADALDVRFAGLDIAELGALPLQQVHRRLAAYASDKASPLRATPEKAAVALRITQDIVARLDALLLLGLGYLALERSTPTLSPGELQRLRLATQMHSNLFGVVYVLDEPSAGLHPSDTETLLHALDALRRVGNSLFVIEHEVDVIRRADWIVDVGPGAGERGGEILYSGPPAGLREIEASKTRHYIDGARRPPTRSSLRAPAGWLRLTGVTRNNLHNLDADFPLGVLTSVTGVSGSGKSTLVSQVLVELAAQYLGQKLSGEDEEEDPLAAAAPVTLGGSIEGGMEGIRRLVQVDQKPIGRTPRSNMATYTGLFDHVRRLFAETRMARERRYDAGRFSFNVAKGRCPTCAGEGFVCVELLFLPSVYSPCPDCHGARFNPKTLEVKYHDKNIAEVLRLTVDDAIEFFAEEASVQRALSVLSEVGLGYLRLGQPATELSGGEAQRIKLATELQRPQKGDTLYVLDEPTTGLHPSDVERLLAQLNRLVDHGNTVIVVEHDLDIIAASDWIIDIGPGAGEEGGTIVAAGTPKTLIQSKASRTAPYLKRIHFPEADQVQRRGGEPA